MSNTYLTDLKNKIAATAGLSPLEREKELRNLYCHAVKEIISCYNDQALLELTKSMKDASGLAAYAMRERLIRKATQLISGSGDAEI